MPNPVSIRFCNSTIHLLGNAASTKEMCQHDRFTDHMSKFDVQSRIGTAEPCGIQDYFDFIASHLINWDEESSNSMISIIKDVAARYGSKFGMLKLPEHINIVLTDGKDESGAAYCRSSNIIVLPVTSNRPVKPEPKIGEKGFEPCDTPADTANQSSTSIKDCANGSKWYTTFIHELFHIWSRNNIDVRNRMYERIGYHLLDKPLSLPGNLAYQKITNPDAPAIDCYTLLKSSKNKIYMPYVPVLYSKEAYDPSQNKSFFDYLEFVLMGVQITHPQNGQDSSIALDPSNILKPGEEPAFYDLIGHNTKYIIHPEEILADNFVLYVMNDERHSIEGVDSFDLFDKPEILKMMGEVFSQSKTPTDSNNPITSLKLDLATLQNRNAALKKELVDEAEQQKLQREIEKFRQENEQIENAKRMRQRETNTDISDRSAETMLLSSHTRSGSSTSGNKPWYEYDGYH